MAVYKSSVPQPHRRFVELMQQVNFGRIEQLVIADGEPVLHPLPKVIREIKFGGENGPRPEADIDDFILKSQAIELFRMFDEVRDGVIEVLEVKHGLPFRMFLRESDN